MGARCASEETKMADRAWYEIVRDVLKQHNVSLVP
jgi:hypothetical protein